MEMLLILALLINSVFGDKLGRGYLPPPGDHISGGDLTYSDLPFELPNDYPLSDYKSTPDIKYGFTDDVESEGKTYDDSTTTQPITDYSSSLPPQTTMAYFINQPKVTESIIPQFVINQSSGYNLHMKKLNGISTRPDEMRSSVNDKYPSSAKSLPVSEAESLNMDYMSPGIVFRKDSEIFDHRYKNNTDTSLNEPSVSSQNNDKSAIITNEKNNLTPDEFSYSFETSNGLHTDVVGNGKDGIKSKGSFSYIGDDGKLYMMEYTADENGFKPKGAHLPTPPPIPKEIQNVIEQAYKDKAAGIFDDGSYNEERYGYKNYMRQFKNEVSTENKDNIIQKTKGLVKETNIFEENGLDNVSGNMAVIGGINTVKIIYNQGYDYVRPKDKLMKDIQSSITILPNSGNIATNSNTFESSTPNPPISNGHFHDSENDYRTTMSVLESTYYDNKNYNNDEKPRETSQTEISNTKKPIYYFDDLNNVDMPNNDTERSTMNSESITADIPSTESIPIYVSNRGEDFSGPNQKPTYHPDSGYYY